MVTPVTFGSNRFTRPVGRSTAARFRRRTPPRTRICPATTSRPRSTRMSLMVVFSRIVPHLPRRQRERDERAAELLAARLPDAVGVDRAAVHGDLADVRLHVGELRQPPSA